MWDAGWAGGDGHARAAVVAQTQECALRARPEHDGKLLPKKSAWTRTSASSNKQVHTWRGTTHWSSGHQVSAPWCARFYWADL